MCVCVCVCSGLLTCGSGFDMFHLASESLTLPVSLDLNVYKDQMTNFQFNYNFQFSLEHEFFKF